MKVPWVAGRVGGVECERGRGDGDGDGRGDGGHVQCDYGDTTFTATLQIVST